MIIVEVRMVVQCWDHDSGKLNCRTTMISNGLTPGGSPIHGSLNDGESCSMGDQAVHVDHGPW